MYTLDLLLQTKIYLFSLLIKRVPTPDYHKKQYFILIIKQILNFVSLKSWFIAYLRSYEPWRAASVWANGSYDIN